MVEKIVAGELGRKILSQNLVTSILEIKIFHL